MKSLYRLLLVIFTVILFSFNWSQPVAAAAEMIDPGTAYFQAGRFEEAAAVWEDALAKLSADRSPTEYLDMSIQLAAVYHSLGRLQRALEILQQAESIATKLNDPIRQANVLSQLADIYLALRKLNSEDLRRLLGPSSDSATPTGMMEKTQQYLERAEKMIEDAGTKEDTRLVLANILNKKGNLLVIQKKYERAIETYEKSESLAERTGDAVETYEKSEFLAEMTGDAVLVAKTSLNRLQALIDSGETDSIEKELADKTILQRVNRLPDSHDKAFALIRLAYLVQSSSPLRLATPRHRYAYETLLQALETAGKQRDNLAIAYAKVHLAQLYAEERRYGEAIALTKQAIYDFPILAKTFSEKPPELLFRWTWQLGKYLKAMGRIEEARLTYERAKRHLQIARGIYRCGPEEVCKNIQDFYFELVDLQLRLVPINSDEKQHLLKDVIDNIESFKFAELQNYLNSCPKQLWEYLDAAERLLANRTVVLYPIVLDDRLELLLVSLSLLSRIDVQRFTVSVKRDELMTEMEGQLNNLRNFRSSWPPNDKLYQWLIKPIEETLVKQHINTLVIVPHGNLTRLPFAALYDGQKYLVEKYAVAVIPGLGLTDLAESSRMEPIRALLVGASKFIKLSPLSYAKDELDSIKKVFGGKVDILQDKGFTIANIEAKLREHAPYSIIHFSTYGYFGNRSEETFLQTYDAPWSMDKLKELINADQPLELLTLSASDTALKGESYSLALMGIGLKTGVRSVLASLWNVNDKATAELMTKFYQHWQRNDFSNKAKALQQAQLELLHTREFQHPYYWASFVLIGNWQ